MAAFGHGIRATECRKMAAFCLIVSFATVGAAAVLVVTDHGHAEIAGSSIRMTEQRSELRPLACAARSCASCGYDVT